MTASWPWLWTWSLALHGSFVSVGLESSSLLYSTERAHEKAVTKRALISQTSPVRIRGHRGHGQQGGGLCRGLQRTWLRRGVLPLLLAGAEPRVPLPVPRGDAVLPHVGGPRDVVELLVEAAAVADLLAVGVAPPQGGHRGVAVGAPDRGIRLLTTKLNVIILLTTLQFITVS